jgi:hypothetical protein
MLYMLISRKSPLQLQGNVHWIAYLCQELYQTRTPIASIDRRLQSGWQSSRRQRAGDGSHERPIKLA